MQVRHVGFFSDLPHGIPSEPTLRSAIGGDPFDDEVKLIEYLVNGALFIASPGIVRDILSEQAPVIGSADILTDGVWVWPRDLAYYVRQYQVRLPNDFVEHARTHHWMIPPDIPVETLTFEV